MDGFTLMICGQIPELELAQSKQSGRPGVEDGFGGYGQTRVWEENKVLFDHVEEHMCTIIVDPEANAVGGLICHAFVTITKPT